MKIIHIQRASIAVVSELEKDAVKLYFVALRLTLGEFDLAN